MTELIQPIRPARAMSWANLLQDFVSVELMSVSPNYRGKAQGYIGKFILHLSRSQMDARSVAGYALWLQDTGIHPNTIQKHISVIRRFMTWCFRMGYTETRWYEYLPKVRGVPFGEPIIIGHEEYLLLRRMCGDSKEKEFVIVLGWSTGLRLGDCCNLCWSSVDREQQIIMAIPHKTVRITGKAIRHPYATTSDLYPLLVERWQERDTNSYVGKDYVCPVLANSYNNEQTSVTHQFREIFNRAGLAGKSFKHFRSTFESRMANSGMNIGLAATLTGRSDTKTLLRYIKPDMDVAREGIVKALELHKTYPAFK